MVLFLSSATGLQTSLNIFQQYCKTWLETLHKSQKDKNHDIWETMLQINAWEIFFFLINNDPIEISQDLFLFGTFLLY